MRIATQADYDRLLKRDKAFTPPAKEEVKEATPKVTPGVTPDELDTLIENLKKNKKYEPLEFVSPEELLKYANPHASLYEWQKFASDLLCGKLTGKPTDQAPLIVYFPAVNGSGKDAFVLASFAAWFCCTKIRSRCIITSASFNQLKYQTEQGIRTLCEALNDLVGEKIFHIVHFHIVCTRTCSEIKLYVTDEAGRAEGFHPWSDYPGAEMALITNEAKSVSEWQFDAFDRCTGYNYWIEVSSPGAAKGHFYKAWQACTKYPAAPTLGVPYGRKIRASDCPHISQAHINKLKQEHGEFSALYRSIVECEFTASEEGSCIPQDYVDGMFRDKTRVRLLGNLKVCGIDLALGGDETVVQMFNGSHHRCQLVNKMKNAPALIEWIEEQLTGNGYVKGEDVEDQYITADDNGLGRPIIQELVRRGWRISTFLAQTRAVDSARWGNLGAEAWNGLKQIIHKLSSDVKDDTLREQLWSRKFRDGDKGKYYLEAKRDIKKSGGVSPDRADAFVIAWSRLWRKLLGTVPAIENKTGDGIQTIMQSMRIGKQEVPERTHSLRQRNILCLT